MVFPLRALTAGSRYVSGYRFLLLARNSAVRHPKNVRFLSVTPPGPPKKEETFDDFRVREEKREQEFENAFAKEQEASQKQEKQSHEEKEDSDDTVEIRNKILEAALNYVPQHGWSKTSLAHGAEQVGYPSIAHGMFSRGGVEIVEYLNAKFNKDLIDEMLKMSAEEGKYDTPTKFVAKAVELRLRMLEPYKDSWPQALALMALPPNVPVSLSNLLTMVDDICYYAGDRSVDFNWYTRRIGLASIYKATEFFMLQDKSPDHQKTWNFLEHRISDASKMQDFLKHSEGLTKGIQQTGKSIFDTARNILGMNFDRSRR
ncbi:ubiquinone biosynthesis protein COQ9, mitochondrial [Culicoides brevitarsis]|uniref:ubiquinone biosynthesis protein COQ9, mitochondrial n=1 Tax=Culicoides brevitarsis TaxID=469753 RepID=UPI00307BB97C